uniref:Uncharacterized protein n=2 Tax=Caenorhabditis japonica TaxID=281687 RepID=A0A8R1DJX3_CAEJA
MRELRYFLSNIAVSGVFFSTSLLALQPQTVSRGSMTIRVVHGPAQYLPENAVKGITCVIIVSYLYAILSFPMFFFYRSITLANSNKFGQYFTKRNLLITFIILFVISCVESGIFYYSCIPYNILLERVNRTTNIVEEFENNTMLLNQHLRNIDINLQLTTTATSQISSGIIQTQEEMNMEKHHLSLFGDDYSRNPLTLIFYGVLLLCHVLSYFTISICANFIMKTLKRKQGTMSQDTFLENRLLVHSVFAESIVPLLLSAPVGANAVLITIYENSLSWQEFLPTYFMSMVPVLSPLCTIMFIVPYRNAVVSFLTLKSFRGNSATAAANKNNDSDD